MAESSKEKKLSLKIMVDNKAKKVVFAEAEDEFVDFLFTLISLPLSTVTKVLLLNEKGMVGSLGALYKSIESLGAQYFDPNIKNDTALKPIAPVNVPLLSLRDLPASIRFFKCPAAGHYTISDVPGYCSQDCNWYMTELIYYYGTPQKIAPSPQYVKDSVVYMVMDNLDLKPMSIALIKSHVKDFDGLEEKQVEVGLQEGLAILKASLETDTVLTTVFLKNV
ncbi:hypothetical protein RND81_10G139300 [Saponaria officinalis]|uniref:DUF674 domain-containing protein n=1 Tax=Saponaria officinalis TaxID=3572 RepID=A0AAW1I1S0_SAPOF